MRGLYAIFSYPSDAHDAERLRAEELVSRIRSDTQVDAAHVATASRFTGTGPVFDSVVVSAWSCEPGALKDVASAIDDLSVGSLERLDLVVEATRVHGNLLGFVPDTAGVAPLGADEPAIIYIGGFLAPHGIAPFYGAAPGVVGQAFGHPGYLTGLFLTNTSSIEAASSPPVAPDVVSPPLETVSFSFWRSYRDAADYAYSQGIHDTARQQDRAEKWHDERDFFVRLRPLDSQGTFDGTNPFAYLVG